MHKKPLPMYDVADFSCQIWKGNLCEHGLGNIWLLVSLGYIRWLVYVLLA